MVASTRIPRPPDPANDPNVRERCLIVAALLRDQSVSWGKVKIPEHLWRDAIDTLKDAAIELNQQRPPHQRLETK